ncbi:MAG: hypothetical protein ING90_20685 [Rhodocyclaceae bacterium]|nr:hypothetical protein [Rhodocyclaceae bacterium]MCA3099441.1 hypothetical protein [Rhodocyclaceae bacterium]MCA3117039.1 hypothetical protein [Rhodocyclaceae bacterium]MCA3125062.1 hypothetical protein [Rhodocyclaceae bacterium]MCA3126809.1 hypothetical protein [Rhodocyclaceae bacterium]
MRSSRETLVAVLDRLCSCGQSCLDGQADVVLIYPRADAFDKALPVFDFPKSIGLRLWVLPFYLVDRVLILPHCVSLDAPFTRNGSPLERRGATPNRSAAAYQVAFT